MRKGHEIGKWTPWEWESWFSSDAVQRMKDFQECWFFRLLGRSWMNSQMPCHLPSDAVELSRMAKCPSLTRWNEHSSIVMAQFRRTATGEHIYNEKLLEIYNLQLESYERRKKAGSKGGAAKASNAKQKCSNATSSSSNASECYSSESVSDSSSSVAFEVQESPPPELKVELRLETFDHEEFVRRCREIYVGRGRDAPVAHMACCEAIEYEVEENKKFNWRRSDAANFILSRTEIAADLMRSWPKEERGWWPTLYTFMHEHRYRDEYAVWDKSNGKEQSGNSVIDGALERYQARKAGGGTIQGAESEVPKLEDRR